MAFSPDDYYRGTTSGSGTNIINGNIGGGGGGNGFSFYKNYKYYEGNHPHLVTIPEEEYNKYRGLGYYLPVEDYDCASRKVVVSNDTLAKMVKIAEIIKEGRKPKTEKKVTVQEKEVIVPEKKDVLHKLYWARYTKNKKND